MSKFELNNQLITLFEFVAQINPSIILPEGNRLAVMSVAKNSYFRAIVDQQFSQAAIYSLTDFTKMAKLFGDSVVEQDEESKLFTFVSKTSSKATGRFMGCDCFLVESPPDYDVGGELEFDATMDLSSEFVSSITKSARVIGANRIKFSLNHEKPSVVIYNSDQPNGSTLTLEVDASIKNDIEIVIDLDDFKIFNTNYTAKFSNEGLLVLVAEAPYSIYHAIAAAI